MKSFIKKSNVIINGKSVIIEHLSPKFDEVIVDGKTVKRTIIPDSDSNKFCLRSTKELLYNADNNLIKPCNNNFGVQNFRDYKQLISDVNNGIKRKECNSCWHHEATREDLSYRQIGNIIWANPDHGNCHVSISTKKNISQENFKTIENIVIEVAKDYNKMACIGFTGSNVIKRILENNDDYGHLAKLFFTVNKMKDRKLNFDFQLEGYHNFNNISLIINYWKKLLEKYKPYMSLYLKVEIASLGENYNYLHPGNDFNQFDFNFSKFIKNIQCRIECYSVLNVVSIQSFPEFLKYINYQAKKRKIDLKVHVTNEKNFDIGLLDKRFLVYINKCEDFLKNKHILFNGLEELYNQLTEVRYRINKNYNNNLAYHDALDFFEKCDKGKDKDKTLQKINPELYNYLIEKCS